MLDRTGIMVKITTSVVTFNNVYHVHIAKNYNMHSNFGHNSGVKHYIILW